MPDRKILIVEDDSAMCDEFAEILRLEGYSVDMAYDGLEGRRMLDGNDYDVVILDLNLPGFSGIDLLKYIRAGLSARVIVITGEPIDSELRGTLELEDEKRLEALKLADGCTEKPFDIEKILKSIEELSASAGSPPPGRDSGGQKPRREI
jgi:DNA-binding response OmpR family regulator